MGKWFSHSTYFSNKKMLDYHKTDDPTKIEYYYPWVIQIANTFPRDAVAIGCLTINDLIQAGMVGLVEAWGKVDLEKDQASIWTFLKNRIKWAIRREIDKAGLIISIPINVLEDARNKLDAQNVDKHLVNIFPKFFDGELWLEDKTDDSWLSLELEGLIIDELDRVESNVRNKDIFLRYYSIGFDKYPVKKLADIFDLSEQNIKQICFRLRNKLKNEIFEKKIENFYENW